MAITSTKRHANWTGTTFAIDVNGTVTGTTTITGVTGVEVDPSGNVIKFSGDGDRYPTTIVSDFVDNAVTVTTADMIALRTLPPGTRGTFVTTHNDAKNLAISGSFAMTYTLSHAIVVNSPTGGQHRQFGQGRVILAAESTDGITNPLVVTIL